MSKIVQHVKPCEKCPFRKTSAGMITGDRAEDLSDALRSDGHMLCHKTLKSQGGKHELLCAGSIIVASRSDCPPSQMERVMSRIGMLDARALEKSIANDTECFDDLETFTYCHEESYGQ